MPSLSLHAWHVRFLRFAFHHFYNSFAWTYDAVSAIVSLGHWRGWTRMAIPHLRGKYILEIAFGTGNLQLDMRAAGIEPYGLDLSPIMARITLGKLRRAGYQPRLTRGSVLDLPFASGAIDTLVMTFPPNFLASPQAVGEMKRVLAADGRLVLVDAGWLRTPGMVSTLINVAFRFTGTSDIGNERTVPLQQAGFAVRVVESADAASTVQIIIADKVVQRERLI
jgi:ubiquinone/menaquinone biosynthesis C-methylase UbiE